jgi:type IV secretory pathway VirB10-like protein
VNDVAVKSFAVARRRRPVSASGLVASLAMLGAGVFIWLADARATIAQQETKLPPLASNAIAEPVPLSAAPVAPPVATKTTDIQLQKSPLVAPLPVAPNGDQATERLRAPALIVDLAQNSATPTGQGLPERLVDSGQVLPTRPSEPVAKTLSDEEQFSSRVGKEDVDVAEATRMTNLDSLVAQGTIIGAVMETALNSDLPGFARAVIQRDVLSFDGSTVLIPAGSRAIGQYKSGVAKGASRIFIVWTRILRPDGASISIGSPAVDDLGRGGVAGKVNGHFLKRFGGSILLTVLTGGISAATTALSRGSTVVVGTASEASTLAQQAASDLDIPPTIVTKAGASVRIFVARDLDFSNVEPLR